jgi:hypothetical protein
MRRTCDPSGSREDHQPVNQRRRRCDIRQDARPVAEVVTGTIDQQPVTSRPGERIGPAGRCSPPRIRIRQRPTQFVISHVVSLASKDRGDWPMTCLHNLGGVSLMNQQSMGVRRFEASDPIPPAPSRNQQAPPNQPCRSTPSKTERTAMNVRERRLGLRLSLCLKPPEGTFPQARGQGFR